MTTGNLPPFGQARPQVEPDKVRLSLKAMLDDLRGAREGSPRPQETMRLNRLIFPQMSNWLPPGSETRCASISSGN
jgi:hypothetical protein